MTNKSWEKWKNHFLKAHEGFKRHIQACRGADQFVRATANPHPTNVLPLTPSLLEYMDIYLDNMINTVTNEKAVLSELVATNTNQEVTIDTQASTIKTSLARSRYSKSRSTPSRSAAEPPPPPLVEGVVVLITRRVDTVGITDIG